MKKIRPVRRLLTSLLLSTLFSGSVAAQGRVVINEYLPWTLAGCGSNAEFIELLNFGPGPMNIGCYILTDGDYSITIPANTILQPGEFYVIAGMDIIAFPCANIDSTIQADLNWSTCNCTSSPIPLTGDGFMTDGGSANEQLVLLDPQLNVIDAVARSLPVESSALITPSSNGGTCTTGSFDLDLMSINYETIGESAGRGNSFARRLDGDCGWVKDPQQSGNATNNTPGDVSDVSYSFFYTNAMACPDNGSIAITVHAADYSNVFPMSYTLAFDTDGDGIFESTDSYTTGTVSTPNKIILTGLIPGSYRLTVASVKGCYLKTFPFRILDCFDALAVKLIDFSVLKTEAEIRCNWILEDINNLHSITIERSRDGLRFTPFQTLNAPDPAQGINWNSFYPFREETIILPYFRLLIRTKDGNTFYSSVIKLNEERGTPAHLWPNPVKEMLFIRPASTNSQDAILEIIDSQGRSLLKKRGADILFAGNWQIPTNGWQRGLYRVIIRESSGRISSQHSFLKL